MWVGAPRLRAELRDARDRLIASDPGGTRLRGAARATVVVASTLVVERLVAQGIGAQPLMLMLLGAIVTIPMSTGIRDTRGMLILRTAVLSPVASAVGVTLAVFAAERRVLGLAVFVIVAFTAVWVRRFGPRWFHYGFLLWQSYFFALFLHPPVSMLPSLLVGVLAATVWVALLLATVLHDDPEARLRRTITALRARARSVISTCLDVLADPGDRGARRSLRTHRIQLAEAVLLLDGQLSDDRALPEGLPPARMRRWIVDIEIEMDRLCGAVLELAAELQQVPRRELHEVREVLREVAWAHPEAALAKSERLQRDDTVAASRRVATAGRALVGLVDQWDSGALRRDREDDQDEGGRNGGFEPVVRLTGGNLPGSASLAERSVRSDHAGRWSTTRLRLTTRQAVQAGTAAGLAILLGDLISSQRYYWAVIAAFVGFAGTATAGETLRKGVARVAGTVGGLVVAVAVADLTAGDTWLALVVTLVCVFCAFYLQAVSYGAMIFFITVLLGQLYTMLHSVVDQLLVIRLEETVVGAAIGISVSFLVLPAGSRATLRTARAAFMEQLADLVRAAAVVLAGRAPERDLLALTIELDEASRQVLRTERGMTYGRFFGAARVGIRHRVTMLGVCAAAGRALAASLSARPVGDAHLAQACEELADECRRLAAARRLWPPPELPEGTAPVAARVDPLLETASSEVRRESEPERATAVLSLVAIVHRLTRALTLLGHEPSRRDRNLEEVTRSRDHAG